MTLPNTTKLYIFCGIPFSGKTTLAKRITQIKGYTRINLDEIKFQLFGSSIKDEQLNQDNWDQIYHVMYQQIQDTLQSNSTVLHDTGNFTQHERNLVRQIAQKLNIDAITIFVDTPINVAKQRLLQNRQNPQRFDVNDADFISTIKEMEPPNQIEKHLIYQHTQDMDTWITRNIH